MRGARGEVNDPEGLRKLLGDVMVRNRRGEVGVEFTARKAETRRLEMGPEQRALYESAVDFCRRRFPEVYGDAATLVTVGYLRMLCASPFRFRESLVGNLLSRAQEAGAKAAVREVKDLIELADAVPWDVKLEALASDLAAHDEKAVVFTHYRGLLRYVAARLRKDKASLALFHGAMSADDKDEAVERFRGDIRVPAVDRRRQRRAQLAVCSAHRELRSAVEPDENRAADRARASHGPDPRRDRRELRIAGHD